MGALQAAEVVALIAALRARMHQARHALPGLVEKAVPGQPVAHAVSACAAIQARGMTTTVGYFHAERAGPGEVAAACQQVAAGLGAAGLDSLVAIKANALDFDRTLLRMIAAEGVPLMLDATAPQNAASMIALAEEFAIGLALPARWQRSAADAFRLRGSTCRIRLVKGEWADPAADMPDIATAYRELARLLAGRAAPVGVATHDPELAEAALSALVSAGTPCELEQLRGLPRRRTMALAKRLGVPVRLYYPFGPGWWPYALDQALNRPYLPIWALRDALTA